MSIVLYIALTLTVFLVLALLLAPLVPKPSTAAKRIRDVVKSTRPDKRKMRIGERTRDLILSMADSLRSRMEECRGKELRFRSSRCS
jgi:hypothetical protein